MGTHDARDRGPGAALENPQPAEPGQHVRPARGFERAQLRGGRRAGGDEAGAVCPQPGRHGEPAPAEPDEPGGGADRRQQDEGDVPGGSEPGLDRHRAGRRHAA